MATISLSELRGVGGGEVSIIGEALVNKGSTNTYEITDYDSFSVYSVTTSVGSASVSGGVGGGTITLTIPSVTSAKNLVLTVVRDSEPKVYNIGIEAAGIVTPTITSPANNSSNQSTSLTIAATPYATTPAGNGVLIKSEWTVARDSGFTDVVATGSVSTGNMTRWTAEGLPLDTTLYVRVRYQSSTLGWSAWASPVKFTTIGVTVDKPTISLNEPSYDVKETPTFQGNAFSTTPANMDSHLSSSWRIRKASDDSDVYTLNRSMSRRYELTVPEGVLDVSTEYYAQVKYEGSSVGESMWSDKLTFTTAETFVPEEAGTYWEGGVYAGRINVDGNVFAVVLASRLDAGAVATGIQWKTSQSYTPNTNSTYDCKANMQGAIAAGINSHPAFKHCYEFRGGGHSDWLLPSADVLEILYRNFKPFTQNNYTSNVSLHNASNGTNPNSIPVGAAYTTSNPSQTSLDAFKRGGAEAFDDQSFYYAWSSTQYSATYAWNMLMYSGYQYYTIKTLTAGSFVRPVRLVPIG